MEKEAKSETPGRKATRRMVIRKWNQWKGNEWNVNVNGAQTNMDHGRTETEASKSIN